MGFDFCNETARQSLIAQFKRDVDLKPLYMYLCPVIIFVCFFSIIFNAILISISRQSKFTNKSPILLLSLNLAVTDLIASLLNALSILFNSYLPEVFKIQMLPCSMLMFEVVRCAALIASALHLLALAFVHYRGIVSPLQYRSTVFFSQHLSRMINIISIFCWIIPLTILIVWFSSTPCQGFQTAGCDYLFLLGSAYRYMVLSVFLLPLVIMVIIYVRIFIIISRHQRGRRLEQERSTLTRGVISVAGPVASAAARVNLPQLAESPCDSPIAEEAAKCPVCVARQRSRLRKSNGELHQDEDQEEDELTVSMLGEQTDSSGQSREPSPSASRQRLAASLDNKTSLGVDGDDEQRWASDRRLAPVGFKRRQMSDSNNLAQESHLHCDDRRLDWALEESQRSRKGRANNGSDKALVLILEDGGAEREATPSAASVKLNRVANHGPPSTAAPSAASHASSALSAAAVEHSTIEPPEGLHQVAQPVGEQRQRLRAMLSLGAELKWSDGGDENGANGRRERPSSRLKQQSNSSNASQTQHSTTITTTSSAPSTRNLEKLLHQKCTCDNKLSQDRASGGAGKLARANTIGSDAQRTTKLDQQTTPDRSGCGARRAKAVMSSVWGAARGSSISSGRAAMGPQRLQLRRPAPEGSIKSRLTATTSVTANNTTQCATTVTKTNSNSLAGGALQMSETIENVPTPLATGGPSRTQSLVGAQEATRRHVHASAVPQTNTKALITTLLILGTYFVSYAPAIIYQVLSCIDHCPYPLYEIPYGRRVLYGAITTLMMIAKSIVDPLIYSYRMNEIQMAIGRYLSKRRSKSSSHATSLRTSQRFTFGANTTQQNLSVKSNRHNHHHHNHNSVQSRRPHELSGAESSFKILNKSAGLRTSSALTVARNATDHTPTVDNLKLSRQRTSPSALSNGNDQLRLGQTESENDVLALKVLVSSDKSSQHSSINGSRQSDILGSEQTTGQKAPICNGNAGAAIPKLSETKSHASPTGLANSDAILSGDFKPDVSVSSSLIC